AVRHEIYRFPVANGAMVDGEVSFIMYSVQWPQRERISGRKKFTVSEIVPATEYIKVSVRITAVEEASVIALLHIKIGIRKFGCKIRPEIIMAAVYGFEQPEL